MKKIQKGLLFAILVISVGLMAACEQDESSSEKDYLDEITGSYEGQLFTGASLESGNPASASVAAYDEGQVQIHCTSGLVDTTFIMNVYERGDSIMACLTGDAFEQEYGHMKNRNHMMDHGEYSSDFEHHMEDNHAPGDEHFSSFDMKHHTFQHRFEVMQDDSVHYMEFIGSKIKNN